MFTTFEVLAIYLAAGIAGIFAHYVKKYLNEEIVGSLFNYLFNQYPRKTGLTVFTFLSTAAAYYMTNSLDGISIQALIGLGFGMGYAADSSSNKAYKPNIIGRPSKKKL